MSLVKTGCRTATLWFFLAVFSISLQNIAYPQSTVANTIAEHLQLARKAQQQGEAVRATSEFREALGLTLEQLGGIYNSLGDLGKGELAYGGAVGARADSDAALLGLAIVCLRKGDFQKGVDAVNTLLAQKPLHPTARHLLGKLYFAMGRTDSAVLELEESARLAPDDYAVATTLAMGYLKLKRPENAKKIFSQMVKTLGESARLHVFFAGIYRQADILDEAAAEFKRAASLDPNYPHVHYYLGLSFLASQQGRDEWPNAVTEFKTELRRDPNDYFTNYLLGLVYVSDRKPEDALPFLEKAMRLDPKKPDAPLFLGQALSLMGQEEKAIPVLQRAIELTSDPSRNNYQISNAHYLLAQALRRQGNLQEAARHADLAAKYKTQQASRSVEQLQLYLKNDSEGPRDTAPGLQQGRTGVIIEPEVPDENEKTRLQKAEVTYARIAGDAYNQLGLLSAGQSDFMRAATYFEQAVIWDREIPDIDYNLGLAQFKAEQFREAIAPLERARARQPDRLPVRVLLGLSYFFLDDYSRAAAQLGPLVDSGIDDPEVMFALGLSLAGTGNRQRAGQILGGLVQKFPQAPDVHLAMGRLRALEGDYASASAEFGRALQLNPSVPDAHYYMGLSLMKQSRFAESADEFRKEIQRNPQHARAQYHLGFALLSMQQIDEAVKQFEQAISLDRAYVDAYYELGKTRLQQGRVEDAIKLLEKSVQLDPNKAYCYYQLSQAYLKAGRQAAAEDAMSHYRQLKARSPGTPP